MGITNSNKELSAAGIACGGTFQVKLSLTAEPDIVTHPTDIVLILDRSGSMVGSALDNLKTGANAFIDIIDEATDGAQDGQIGSGNRIAIVSFAGTATQDTQLITSVNDLKAAVDALSADGSTSHADAFTKAFELFAAPSTNPRSLSCSRTAKPMPDQIQALSSPQSEPRARSSTPSDRPVYQVRPSRESGRLRLGWRHLQHQKFQGPVHRPLYRQRFSVLRHGPVTVSMPPDAAGHGVRVHSFGIMCLCIGSHGQQKL